MSHVSRREQVIAVKNKHEEFVHFGNAAARTSNSCVDALYAVNSNGGFYRVDVSNQDYEETTLPSLQGGGSIACALDQSNELLYYNIGTTMYAYNLGSETFKAVFNTNPYGKSYPRLAFKDGFFYMGNNTSMYVVNASTNEVANSYEIQGIVNTAGGGDLAFSSDGTLYLSCFSGLYRFTDFNKSEDIATVERVSAENFPFKLTSMAIGRKDRVFVGTNDAQSKLLEMNTKDGSYRIVKTYDHKINDLTSWRCLEDDLDQTDTDGDGVPDVNDDHPNDPEIAYDVYTPSEIGYGTLAFEDAWPQKGDYDFNDLVINYRVATMLNQNNLAVRMEIKLRIMAVGASFHNGLGFALPLPASQIEKVTGYELTRNLVSVDTKGLEIGHGNDAVIIAFDDANDHMGGSIINTKSETAYVEPKEMTITIDFVNLLDPALIGNPPFNPFIFIDGDRSRELHLKDHQPTQLMDESYFMTGEDLSDPSQGEYYVSGDNVPWGINIIHNFRYPQEKVRIDKGYNHFTSWGSSNGTFHLDWYKDNSGYRKDDRLYIKD